MVNPIIEMFFEPVHLSASIGQSDYRKVEYSINVLRTLSYMTNTCLYVIDYNKRDFLYVGSNPLFLCGYSSPEVKDMGYGFYEKVVYPDDLNLLLEINKYGFSFYETSDISHRDRGYISYDFRLRHKNGRIFMVNHKLMPLVLAEDGNIWLALCVVSLSSQKKPGNMYIQMLEPPIQLQFNFKTRKWSKKKIVKLSQREKEIMLYSSQGYAAKAIADELNVSEGTIKQIKNNLFKKLNTGSMIEAINIAIINKLI